MRLEFSGVVAQGDFGDPEVGGHDVLRRLDETDWDCCSVSVDGVEVARGWIDMQCGDGWSEWTPMESPEFGVGDVDVLSILERYEGQTITLVLEEC